MKAVTPSRWSAVAAMAQMLSASRTDCSSHTVSSEVRNSRLAPPSARVGPSASRRAIDSALASSVARGSTQLNRPHSSAFSAGMRSPSSTISSARRSPTMRGRK